MTHEEKLAELEKELARQDAEWEQVQAKLHALLGEELEIDEQTAEWLESLSATPAARETVSAGPWAVRA